MATIIVSPLFTPGADATGEVVTLEIYAQPADFSGVYDVLEVWRSRSTEDGPYEELTAPDWKSARLPATGGDEPATPVTGGYANVVGLELDLQVNGDENIAVTFTGVDPLTLAAAAAEIETQGAGRLNSYVDLAGVLVVETVDVGPAATLEVTGGEAAPSLGLPTTSPDSLAYGRSPWVQVTTNQLVYEFVDSWGSSAYFYKVRYRNRLTGAVSEFSQPFSATQPIGTSPSNVVVGQLWLVGADGKPLISREVRIYCKFSGILVDGKVVAGLDVIKKTDENGYVEFTLVRGQSMTVGIAGTDLVRDITVPTDSSISTFNLMDPSIAGDDVFKVQVPDVVYAERRTL